MIEAYFLFSGDFDPPALKEHIAFLNPEEKAKMERFLFQKDRDQYLLTRILARHVLSRKTGIPFTDLRFESDRYGKPFLTGPSAKPAFNISHTPGLVVFAVAGHSPAIGIDVENSTRNINPGVRNVVFTEEELHEFGQLPETEQKDRLLNLWTLKESYMKATGKGFFLSPKSFGFSFRDKRFRENPLESAPGAFRFRLYDIEGQYRFAVCSSAPPEALGGFRMLPGWKAADLPLSPVLSI